MNAASRRTLITAGILLALATILGAFGTHGLQPILTPQRFANFELAVNYHFFAALGLLGMGVVQRGSDHALLRWATRLLSLGALLFCGSIYAISFGAPTWFGMVAPIGGTLLIVAWLCFAVAMWRAQP